MTQYCPIPWVISRISMTGFIETYNRTRVNIGKICM